MKFQKGFIMAEIFVVFSVAIFLCSLVLVGIHSIRVIQRDNYRVGVLKEYSKALEAYFRDTGHYPFDPKSPWVASCWVGNEGRWISDNGGHNWSIKYLIAEPHDPLESCIWPFLANDGTPTATFGYWSDGTKYALVALLESGSNKNTISHHTSLWVDGKTDLYKQAGWYGRTYVLTSQK